MWRISLQTFTPCAVAPQKPTPLLKMIKKKVHQYTDSSTHRFIYKIIGFNPLMTGSNKKVTHA